MKKSPEFWILLEKNYLKPNYEQKMFAPDEKSGKLKLVASNDAREGSLKINQDVSVYNSFLKSGAEVSYDFAEKRYGWVQVVKGALEINGESLNAGDGAAISEEKGLKIKSLEDNTEFILFDLA